MADAASCETVFVDDIASDLRYFESLIGFGTLRYGAVKFDSQVQGVVTTLTSDTNSFQKKVCISFMLYRCIGGILSL